MKMDFEIPNFVVDKWFELGYDSDTLPLLFAVPLVQVAWAEGFLQAGERRAILQFVAKLRMNFDDEAFIALSNWCDERPTDEFFAHANDILADWLKLIPEEQSEELREAVFEGCLKVARVSTNIGLLRDRKGIRREERHLLREIGDRLGFSPEYAF
ncbi:MAG TPA: hypothetical protein VK892_16585 [Pyrinomonadaceae bacterium]|nr:hypothetical protein [Pyrinomonadaceae bacterium]